MSDVKAIVSALFEPIALIGWLLIALTWLLLRQPGSRFAQRLCVAITAAFFVVGSPFTANALLAVLEDQASRQALCAPPGSGSVLVVLAGGVSGEPSEVDDYGRLKEASFRRLVPAVRVAKGIAQSVLVVSGGQGGAVREADLMGAFARDLGMPAARVIAERESRTTFESARQVTELLRGRGTHHAHLVTSALHMPRAVGAFRSAGLAVCPLPVDYRRVRPEWHEGLIPQVTALRKTAEALHEILGYFGYMAFGMITGD